jgi:beta-adrenergic-receptor kinase
MKAKEGIVPKLEQFQVIRVLGEGGFGQVIEVIKRDCGVRYTP